MIRLSAFADEISPDLDEQIAVLTGENIHYLELRGVWGVNVLDFTDEQVTSIKRALNAHGIGVSAIGSPIGKVPVDSSFAEHMQRFERAIQLAHIFQTPYIRIFSFYPPASRTTRTAPSEWRDEVHWRLRALTVRAREEGITLLHENEKDIYGDTIARCVDILHSVNDEHFRAILDPANFIQCGQNPYPDAYETLRSWLSYIHVKDALPNGTVVAADEGATNWPALLHQLHTDGYDGFFSLEPHLASAGQFQGFSGPALFRKASQALQGMLREMGWEYA
ncbi:MAG TPA: sugar phosphate isomerase/epimerase family protein [Ktedonobacteraceae bacterium]|nr:sugar phosphate isomerase/epimerase family protein [Ktedonobacteraceae bacterium]